MYQNANTTVFSSSGLAASGLAVFVAILVGCNPSTELKRTALSTVPSEKGMVGRSLLMLDSGPCVIFHPPPTIQQKMKPLEDDVQVVERGQFPDHTATGKLLSAGDWSTFNCASFALCELLPLTAKDWIEPGPLVHNYCTCPAQVVLDGYAVRVMQYREESLADFDSEPRLRDGDIVSMEKSEADSEIVHLGRVHREGGKNWVISKLGTGDLIRCSMARLLEHYPSQAISIYRGKSAPHSS